MSRAVVRQAVANWISEAQITNLNQVLTSFPKTMSFQVNSFPGQNSRAVGIVFIENESETRIAIGGVGNMPIGEGKGWKRVDYGVAFQVYLHSLHRNSEDAMADFDQVIDDIKDRIRAGQHTLGEINPNLIWQAAEPFIDVSYSEPQVRDNGATEIWAAIRFTVTQMIES